LTHEIAAKRAKVHAAVHNALNSLNNSEAMRKIVNEEPYKKRVRGIEASALVSTTLQLPQTHLDVRFVRDFTLFQKYDRKQHKLNL
jgi:hypothetical protein